MCNFWSSNPTLTNCTFSSNSADDGGGGIFNYDSSPTVTDCNFIGNSANNGAGMENNQCSPTLAYCTFSDNDANNYGGAMYNDNSDPNVTKCTFSGNYADYDGGGMCNDNSSPTLTDCTFNTNEADRAGGMYNVGGSSPTLIDCTFSGNSASLGGGMYNWSNSNSILTNCTFSGNRAESSGGGMCNDASDPNLDDCTFSGNEAYWGGGMYNGNSSPTLTNCALSGNRALKDGGGMYNIHDSSLALTNCTFTNNSASSCGGGMYNSWSSNPNLTNCTFSENTANRGSGMYNYNISEPNLDNCTFRGNQAFIDGGGMYNDTASPTLTNCAFSGNYVHGLDGGGMYNNAASPTLTNCTFSGNCVSGEGGGMYNDTSDPNLTNCILWKNAAGICPQMVNHESSPTISYSDIDGCGGSAGWIQWFGIDGGGNIDEDPCFVDAEGPDNKPGTDDDNLRLSHDSPCIDAGDNTVVTVTTDLDGNPRIIDIHWKPNVGNPPGADAHVDMGAYEYRGPIYVDRDRPHSSSNNGSTWDKAYRYLQDALAAASVGNQIWVGQSSTLDYVPDQNSTWPNGYTGPGDGRAMTFQLKSGVEIYGGYAGWGTTDPDARDIELYETVLSGDRDSNDGPNFVNYGHNSYHVVTGSGVDETAVLDGFTIRGGNADGAWGSEQSLGGGMYNFQGSPTIAYCTFRENRADYASGAMHNYSLSNPRIYCCTFTKNTGTYSGAMQNRNSSAPTLTNCIFYGNTASHSGAISNHSNSSPTLLGCLFVGNSAAIDGGAVRNTSNSNPDLINCTFSANEATSGDGGGIFNDFSSPTLSNCILWGNTDIDGMDESAQIYNNDPNTLLVVNYCCVRGLTGGLGGTGNIGDDPLFKDPNGPDGNAGTEDDNLRLMADSPCIDQGDNSSLPLDTYDLDNDGDNTEPIPLDLDGHDRITDDGCGRYVVDMGAYEFGFVYIGDFDGSCKVDFRDYAILTLAWLLQDGEIGYEDICDISQPPDAIIDEYDLRVFVDNWLTGTEPEL